MKMKSKIKKHEDLRRHILIKDLYSCFSVRVVTLEFLQIPVPMKPLYIKLIHTKIKKLN